MSYTQVTFDSSNIIANFRFIQVSRKKKKKRLFGFGK